MENFLNDRKQSTITRPTNMAAIRCLVFILFLIGLPSSVICIKLSDLTILLPCISVTSQHVVAYELRADRGSCLQV